MTLMLALILALASASASPKKADEAPPPATLENVTPRPEEARCLYRLQDLLDALAQQRRNEVQAQRGDDAQAALAHVGG